ncbi:MAG: hypothetical protein L0I52_06120 [Staphylococcus equorum]|nr:hypothetical protein [Staphylococcus equorum]MDN6100738.1 hypothetical protein [Lactococcus lactis]MDN6120290.1 hypothetical protein [Lactococcus lactis]MDN6505467.1 hypothetical protein [Lactococcus lactis]MDN6570906.1 hypothetical protein [Staphylococcus equorum]
MEIKQKDCRLAGMSGWLIKGANISIAEDEVTDTRSVVCYPDYQVKSHQEADNLIVYLAEDELELLKKIFRIEE